MELNESEPRNLSDKIVESMSKAEAEDDAEVEANPYIEPLNQPILQAEAELMLKPEPMNRPIPAPDRESIYETPYSTHIYRNYGGSRITIQNNNDQMYSNDQSGNRKWSLSFLIIGLVIGATVTGLSMHFTRKPLCAESSKTSPSVTETPSIELGESNYPLLKVNSTW